MSDVASDLDLRTVGLALLGVVGVALMLLILLWPGPFAPSDRIPFALLFGIPGILSILKARYRYRRG